jgi:hypothetical protein
MLVSSCFNLSFCGCPSASMTTSTILAQEKQCIFREVAMLIEFASD